MLLNSKILGSRASGPWHPDALFQCRCSGIGITYRYATGSGALPGHDVTFERPHENVIFKILIRHDMTGITTSIMFTHKRKQCKINNLHANWPDQYPMCILQTGTSLSKCTGMTGTTSICQECPPSCLYGHHIKWIHITMVSDNSHLF